MEGVTIQWTRPVSFSSGNMRTDLFRPIKRSVSDLSVSSKRKEKPVLETRQSRAGNGGNHVPVVSVQYDVPTSKFSTATPGAFRYKRLNTPLAYQKTINRSKSEDKITSDLVFCNAPEFPLKRSARLDRRAEEQKEEKKLLNQLGNSVDNHRLKGLGVGRCYEYYPPPTAPDHGRGTQPVTPATTPGNSRLGSYQSFTPSQFYPCHDIASFKSAQDRLHKELINESQGHIGQSRQWKNVKSYADREEKPTSRKGSSRYGYLQSPLKFGQNAREHFRDDNLDETRSVHRGQGHTSQGSIQGDDMYGYNKFYRVRCPSSSRGLTSSRTFVVPYGQEMMSLCSSSTPSVPYSTADILYGNEVNGRSPGDDVRQNSFVDGDRSKLKSKDLDYPGNLRRPNSKSATRKSLSIDAVAFEKDKEDQLKGFSATLPSTTKPASHFRPNGIRSNILKGEQLYTAKQNGATNGKEPDDLVAMGTLWSPNNGEKTPQQQQTPSSVESSRQAPSSRSNSLSNTSNTNSYPSKVTSSSSNVHNSMSSSNNTVSSQRKYPSNSIRPIVNVQNNVSGKKNNNLQKEQEAEPKYTDPMNGAPPSFQQRIIELGALEGDTVRWERSKRLKKKKQDRDS